MLNKFIEWISKHGNSMAEQRYQLITLTSVIGLLFNLSFAILKLIIGIASNSIAILSDAINNVTDTLSSALTIITIRFSKKPISRKHPFGYGRIEYISGLVIASTVLVTGLEFLKSSIVRILYPEDTFFTNIQLILLVLTIIGKIFLTRLNSTVGKKVDSSALKAAGSDALSDVLVSTLTVISAIIAKSTGIIIDGYVGVAISLFILYTGISLIKDAINSIIGERPDKSLVEHIKSDLAKYDHVMGAYDLMIHNYGPTIQIASANLEMADYTTVEQAYETMFIAQREMNEKYNIFFSFGLYSVNTYDKNIIKIREQILSIIKATEHGLDLHGFNVDEEEKVMRFDAVVDFSIRDYEKFRKNLTKNIRNVYPDYVSDFNIETEYS